MRAPDQDVGAITIAVALVSVLLLASPLTDYWMRQSPPWYFPYLLWLGLIVLVGWLARRVQRHDL